MKKLLPLILFIFSLGAMAQLPVGELFRFDFTEGYVNNSARPGEGELASISGAPGLVADRHGQPARALNVNQGKLVTGNITTVPLTNITLSLWLNVSPSNITSGIREFVISDSMGNLISIRGFRDNNNALQLSLFVRGEDGLGNPLIDVLTIPASGIFNNQWHNVTFTTQLLNNATIELRGYVDGALASNALISNPSSNPPNIITNPRLIVDPGDNVQGLIDDLRMWYRTLNATEISQINNEVVTPGRIVYVNPNATGNNTGESWANAYTNLATAMHVSQQAEIWATAGTYTPSIGGSTGRVATFVGTDNQAVYGGFNGTETARNQRDIMANPVIMSGDISQDDSGAINNGNNTRSDNALHTFITRGTNIKLDGLTISDGHANGTSTFDLEGGAIQTNRFAGSLNMADCIIEDNFTLGSGTIRMGIADANASLSMDRCTVQGNAAQRGGMIYGSNQDDFNLNIQVNNTVISNNTTLNTASNRVGENNIIWLRSDITGATTNATFTNCTIANNNTNTTGTVRNGIFVAHRINGTVNLRVDNSIIENNTNSGQPTQLLAGPESGFSVGQVVEFDHCALPTNRANATVANEVTGTVNFVNATSRNYRLQSGSAGVDDGNNALISPGRFVDRAGNARIANNTVDIGAYEFGSTASLDDVQLITLKAYPNPAVDVLNVDVNKYAFAKAYLYNLQGQQVGYSSTSNISVSDLSAGIYIVKVETIDGGVVSQQFIKK